MLGPVSMQRCFPRGISRENFPFKSLPLLSGQFIWGFRAPLFPPLWMVDRSSWGKRKWKFLRERITKGELAHYTLNAGPTFKSCVCVRFSGSAHSFPHCFEKCAPREGRNDETHGKWGQRSFFPWKGIKIFISHVQFFRVKPFGPWESEK